MTTLLQPIAYGAGGKKQFFHRQRLFVKDMIFDGCYSIGHGADAYALNVSRVVSCPAVMIVLALADAVIDQ